MILYNLSREKRCVSLCVRESIFRKRHKYKSTSQLRKTFKVTCRATFSALRTSSYSVPCWSLICKINLFIIMYIFHYKSNMHIIVFLSHSLTLSLSLSTFTSISFYLTPALCLILILSLPLSFRKKNNSLSPCKSVLPITTPIWLMDPRQNILLNSQHTTWFIANIFGAHNFKSCSSLWVWN